MIFRRRHRVEKPSPGSGRGWVVAGVLAPLALAALGWERRPRRRVRDVMVTDVLTIEPSATLVDAARRMRDANVGALPVVENGRLWGLVTDRDVVVRAVAEGADPSTARVADVTTRDLLCARPESSVDEAMDVMAECQVGRMPVVDEWNRVVGMITLSSLALRAGRGQEALETAEEVSRRSARAA